MIIAILKVLPFALVGLTILFGSHYLLYRSLVDFLGITNHFAKTVILTVLITLSGCFLLASVIAHFNQGVLAKFFYLISASWMGLAVNLLLAGLLVWVFVFLLSVANYKLLYVPIIGAIVFSAAVIFSAYGAWNAFHPQVKEIEIKLKNLPPDWQGKKAVQLSDIHLGNVHGVAFLNEIIGKTNQLKPDIIFITGDLFDGMDGDMTVFAEPLNRLDAPDGIYFVTGNHEIFLGVDEAYKILAKTKIKILKDELVNVKGLQVIGINYPMMNNTAGIVGSSKNTSEVIASFKEFDRSKPSILLHHAPTNVKEAIASGINLQLSGHTHQGQIFPFGFFTWMIYGKYDYGLHQIGDFNIYTTSGAGTWGPPMRTGNTPEIVEIIFK